MSIAGDYTQFLDLPFQNPRNEGVLGAIIDLLEYNVAKLIDYALDIELASGPLLDAIGSILGIPRTAPTRNEQTFPKYDDGHEYGTGTLYSPKTAVYQESSKYTDDDYRVLLKLTRLKVNTLPTLANIREFQLGLPYQIRETGPAEITFYISNKSRWLFNVIQQLDLLPVPMGVKVRVIIGGANAEIPTFYDSGKLYDDENKYGEKAQ